MQLWVSFREETQQPATEAEEAALPFVSRANPVDTGSLVTHEIARK